jgi:hypothetical protein
MSIEFPVSLARLSLSQELSIPQRQLAAVTLKQYIETHWSSKNEKFVGPEPPEEVGTSIFKRKKTRHAINMDLLFRLSKLFASFFLEVLRILTPRFELPMPMLSPKSRITTGQRIGPTCLSFLWT